MSFAKLKKLAAETVTVGDIMLIVDFGALSECRAGRIDWIEGKKV